MPQISRNKISWPTMCIDTINELQDVKNNVVPISRTHSVMGKQDWWHWTLKNVSMNLESISYYFHDLHGCLGELLLRNGSNRLVNVVIC